MKMDNRRMTIASLVWLSIAGIAAAACSPLLVMQGQPADSLDALVNWNGYYIDGGVLLKRTEGMARVVVEAEFDLLSYDVENERARIAYVYGTGEFSIPAVLDPLTGESEILRRMVMDDHGSLIHPIVRQIAWMSPTTLLFTSLDTTTLQMGLWRYDERTEVSTQLAKGNNLRILSTRPSLGIAIYQRTGPEGTPAVVRIESTGELTETLDLGQVRDVVIVDNETLLVLNASERPDGQATVTFWQDGVPVKTEQHPIIAFRNVDYSSGSILAATQSREDTTPVAYAVYAF